MPQDNNRSGLDINQPFSYSPRWETGSAQEQLVTEIRSLVAELKEDRFERRLKESTVYTRAEPSTFRPSYSATYAQPPTIGQAVTLTASQIARMGIQAATSAIAIGSTITGNNPLMLQRYYEEFSFGEAVPPYPEPSITPYAISGLQYPALAALYLGISRNIALRGLRLYERIPDLYAKAPSVGQIARFAFPGRLESSILAAELWSRSIGFAPARYLATGLLETALLPLRIPRLETIALASEIWARSIGFAPARYAATGLVEAALAPLRGVPKISEAFSRAVPGIIGSFRLMARPPMLGAAIGLGYLLETRRQGGFVPIFGTPIEMDIAFLTGNQHLLRSATYGTPSEDIELAREDLIARLTGIGGIALQGVGTGIMTIADLAWGIRGLYELLEKRGMWGRISPYLARGLEYARGIRPIGTALEYVSRTGIGRAFWRLGGVLTRSMSPWIAIQAATEAVRLIGSEMLETTRFFNLLSAYQSNLAFGNLGLAPGGWGLSSDVLADLAISMAEMEEPGYSGEDIARVLEIGLQGNLFLGVRSPVEIRRRMRNLMRQVRIVQRVFQSTLEDAVKFIREFDTIGMTPVEFLTAIGTTRFATTAIGLPPFAMPSLIEPMSRLSMTFFPSRPMAGMELLGGAGMLAQAAYGAIPGLTTLIQRVGPMQASYAMAQGAAQFFYSTPAGMSFLLASQVVSGRIQGSLLASMSPIQMYQTLSSIGTTGILDRLARLNLGMTETYSAQDMGIAAIGIPVRLASMLTNDPQMRRALAGLIASNYGLPPEISQYAYAVAGTENPELTMEQIRYITRRQEVLSQFETSSGTMMDVFYGAGLGSLFGWVGRGFGAFGRFFRGIGRSWWRDIEEQVSAWGEIGYIERRSLALERRLDELRRELSRPGLSEEQYTALLRERESLLLGRYRAIEELGPSRREIQRFPEMAGEVIGYLVAAEEAGVFSGDLSADELKRKLSDTEWLTKVSVERPDVEQYMLYTRSYGTALSKILITGEATEKDYSVIISLMGKPQGREYIAKFAAAAEAAGMDRDKIQAGLKQLEQRYISEIPEPYYPPADLMSPSSPSSGDIATSVEFGGRDIRRTLLQKEGASETARDSWRYVNIIPRDIIADVRNRIAQSSPGDLISIQISHVSRAIPEEKEEKDVMSVLKKSLEMGARPEIATDVALTKVLSDLNQTLIELKTLLDPKTSGKQYSPFNPPRGGP